MYRYRNDFTPLPMPKNRCNRRCNKSPPRLRIMTGELDRRKSRAIARRIILSIAEGADSKAVDVPLAVNSALNSRFAKAAQEVIEAEPRYVRARLIELAAVVAQEAETEAVAE